ncbi:MAG: FHA domain-containing protein [Ignavibacteriae bacterium]|nr:FHA domain-containing protein [Ignavibacteriota bacterium]
MYATLFCKIGQLAGASFVIKEEATIGKAPGNTIQLYPAVISNRHARIFFDKKFNSYFIEDLKSRNGTKVDGIQVKGKERLDKLNVITFANTFDFVFQVVEPEVQAERNIKQPTDKREPVLAEKPRQSSPVSSAKEVSAPEKKQTIVDQGVVPAPDVTPLHQERDIPAPISDVKKTVVGDDFIPLPKFSRSPAKEARLPVVNQQPVETRPPEIVQKPPTPSFILEINFKGEIKKHTLREGENVIGRQSSCEVQIDDPSISRNHAVITIRSGKITIRDLGSKNHTYVSGKRIQQGKEINNNEKIVFGKIEAVLNSKG